MGRFPLKVLILAVSCVFTAMVMNGCIMEPVKLAEFTDDDEVIDTIEKGAGNVTLFNETEETLTAGNGRISGFDPNKYYMVEEWDQNGNFISLQFITANGTRDINLTGIGRPASGVLTGLTNYHHYRVYSAKPLEGDVSYYYLSDPANTAASATIEAGQIGLDPPDYEDWLVFTPPLVPRISDADSDYDIAKLPISPTGSTESIPQRDYIAQSAAAGTETDYVFFDKTNEILYVLKVVFAPAEEEPTEPTEPPDPPDPPDPDGLIINLTLSFTGDNPPDTTSSSPLTYPQSDDSPVTITVTNASQYDNPATGIIWYIDGTQVGTGASFNLEKSTIAYKIVGVYTITVEAAINGIPYSAAIPFVVTP